MKNVITILVDSVFSDCISNEKTKESSTPFLDSIISDALYAKNVFSYGPYTDAASNGLFCGGRTLDDYGYYFGINTTEYNHYRVFKENGYETVGLYYPFYLIGPKIEKYIDHSIYTSIFFYEGIWTGKYQYYAEKKKESQLTDLEYKILIKFTYLLFDCWKVYYDNLNNYESGSIINRVKNSDVDGKTLLVSEYNKFIEDEVLYINSILELGMNHPLAKINDYDWNRYVRKDTLKKIFKKYKSFFGDLERMELKLNLNNNFPDARHIFRGIMGVLDKKRREDFRYLENFVMSLFGNLFLKNRSQKDMWQPVCSMMTQVNTVLNFIDKREKTEKPLYISIHAEEPHNRLAYFTYDLSDMDMINEEIEYIRPLLDNLGNDFAGSIIYQLSLRYVDLCIKRLVEGLNDRGMLSDTTIMIMADHGSSYTLYPIRNTVVNNFYIENYKTPLLIWNQQKDKAWAHEYKGYYQGGNVFPTLCDVVGIDSENKFVEKSIIGNEKGKDYVITEYMGPGCPDMLNRELWMSINDKRFFVAIKVPINTTLTTNNIVEIYNLKDDSMQINNIVDAMRESEEIKGLLRKLDSRYKEIVESTKMFIAKLDSISFC